MNKSLAQMNKSGDRVNATRRWDKFRLKPSLALIMTKPIDLLQCHFGLTPAEANWHFISLQEKHFGPLRSNSASVMRRHVPALRVSSIKPEPVGKLSLS
jgi:hypothetical protein